MTINFKLYKNPIKSIELKSKYNDENEFNELVFITDNDVKFILTACGDCCSVSLFSKYKQDFSELNGKIIKTIKEIELPDDYNYNHEEFYSFNDVITPHLYEITFTNSKNSFKFIMNNYSNGFYDGWIDSSVEEK
jgi:hypothetical protein